MKRKLRVGVIFGGKSAEHEVSLQSAKSVIEALDKDKYEPVLIGIDKQGRWQLNDRSHYLLNAENPKLVKLNKAAGYLALQPGNSKSQLSVVSGQRKPQIDVAFPVLHGTYGEDGTMQGLLKLMDVPFVGAGVLGSAVGMDKDVMKRLLRDAGLPIAKFLTFHRGDKIDYGKIQKALGKIVFVKPANLGSSVGISKAKDKPSLAKAVKDAFQYDNKILVEQYIKGRELEISVLGNEQPMASVPGELILHHDFYSYDAKYIDDHGASLEIPARLPKKTIEQMQQLAVRAYQALCLEGMARVDMFLTEKNQLVINELNTIPGFTKISMYPKMWMASGLPYSKLLDILISLAIDRHHKEKRLKTSFN
jgi:D-alanine-D-alanine ligase